MSSYSKPKMKAYKAGGDIAPFTFVKLSDDETVVQCGSGEIPIGINMTDDTIVANDDLEVLIDGGGKIKLAADCVRNASLGSAALGKGTPITSGVASVITMEDGVTGDIIAIEWDRHTGRAP